MVDASVLGRNGLIIQYEDVISLFGYNIAEFLRDKKINDKLERMSHEDILLSYLNRETYSINEWIKSSFDFDIDYKDLLSSRIMFKPNMCYSYKVFQESIRNGIKNLIIYSNEYSDAIKDFIPSFQIDTLKYHHGDIVSLLDNNPNCTFITSNPISIEKCKDVKAPFVLTIVDDFIYVKDILLSGIDEELRKQSKLVYFTGILSGGLTNVPRD